MMEPKAITNPILEGNFYTSSKKNTFYQVKVDENYLGLLNTNGSFIKTRMISIRDIVGCRCARRRKRIGENCECHPKGKNRVLSFLENTLDEQDNSAYLHIYSYIMKNSKNGSPQKRESFKLTLRFRFFSNYEDNLKEAIKWRNTLKHLVEKTQWRNPVLKNVENYDVDTDKDNAELKSELPGLKTSIVITWFPEPPKERYYSKGRNKSSIRLNSDLSKFDCANILRIKIET